MEEQMIAEWDTSSLSASTSFSEFSPRLEATPSLISSQSSDINSQSSDCIENQRAVLHSKELNISKQESVKTKNKKKKKQKNTYRIVDENSNEDSLPSNLEISKNNENIVDDIDRFCETTIYKTDEMEPLAINHSSNLYHLETIHEENELSNITNNKTISDVNYMATFSGVKNQVSLSSSLDSVNNEISKNVQFTGSDESLFPKQVPRLSENVNDAVKEKEIIETGIKGKRNPRKPLKTKTKGVQTNIKTPKTVENGTKAKRQNPKMPKNENKILNRNRGGKEAETNTLENGQPLEKIDPNINLPNKPKNKVVLSELSFEETSTHDNVVTNSSTMNFVHGSITINENNKDISQSYYINIEQDVLKQPICFTLPSSSATVTNIEVAISGGKNKASSPEPHQVKIKQEPLPVIDLTLGDDEIVIKKEKLLEEKQIPTTSKKEKKGSEKHVKPNGRAKGKNTFDRKVVSQGARKTNNERQNKRSQKETLKCGYISFSDEETSTDSRECSCSECADLSSDCTCSSCLSSS